VNVVFADAGYWIALRDREDVFHPIAIGTARRLVSERSRIVTTPFVFAEVYARFCRMRNIRQQVVRDMWENPVVQIEQGTLADQQNALTLARRHADKSFSFADALSFIVMERLNVATAISFDGHFKQYGKFEIIDTL
jgi:predicted nucleic acid-binding protein